MVAAVKFAHTNARRRHHVYTTKLLKRYNVAVAWVTTQRSINEHLTADDIRETKEEDLNRMADETQQRQREVLHPASRTQVRTYPRCLIH